MELYRNKISGCLYCVVEGIENLVWITGVDDFEFNFSIMTTDNLGFSFEKVIPEGSLADFVSDPLFELEVLRKWNS